jgi:protein-tyrosine phosphatase
VHGVTHGRTELHFHLLPDVDDGPADDAAAVDLARAALRDGTTTIVCTPHARFVSGARDLIDRVAALRRALQHAGVRVDVRPGAELQATDVARFSPTALDAFSQGPPGARWLLLEAPLDPGGLEELYAAADELLDRGFGVLLGHPERSPQLLADAEGLEALRDQGVLLQVNATSLTGLHGDAPRAAGLGLVRRGAVSVVASDAHGPDRPPSLASAVAVLREHGVEDAGRYMGAAPRALLRNGIRAPVRARAA